MNKFTIQQLQQMRVGEELKLMSDAMYLKILQESEADFSEKICEGHSPKTSNGIQLTPLYEGMKFRAGVTNRIEDTNVPVNVLVNVPINVPVNLQVNIPTLAIMFNKSDVTIVLTKTPLEFD